LTEIWFVVRHPLCPQCTASQDLRKPKLPYRQLNNPSCQNGNLAAHIPTHSGLTHP
jgi:hypothetical protein